MLLRDTVTIKAAPAAVFGWLRHLDRYYIQWHPDHISCRYLKGDDFDAGSILFCQEYLHGKPHKFRMRLKTVEPDRRVDYVIGPGMRGSFEVEAQNGGTLFTAELRLGWPLPFLGKAQDVLLSRLFSWRIDALKLHMEQEGENLRMMLEEG